MPTVIPAGLGGLIVSIEYAENGLDWARLYDNPIIGWVVDETTPAGPDPVIIGQLPTAAPDTAPILSPQWVNWVDPTVFVPDLWRSDFGAFLTWLATNNGATRQLDARLGVSDFLRSGFESWSRLNPTLVWSGG